MGLPILSGRRGTGDVPRLLKRVARVYANVELHLVVMDKLHHPQTRQGEEVARGEPEDPRPFHPDFRVLAQPGRGLVQHHRTQSHPPRILRLHP